MSVPRAAGRQRRRRPDPGTGGASAWSPTAARARLSLRCGPVPLLGLGLAFALAGCAADPSVREQAAGAGEREALGTQPDLPYSEAVRVGDTWYFSGKIGASDETRALTEGRTAAEARNVLESFRTAFSTYGLDFAGVVKAHVYLTDIDDFAEMNAVYREYFPSDPPARTTVAVAALPGGAAIEISFIVAARARR